MTTIKQLLEMPLGTRINPGTLSIKTAKKKWQVKDVWWQQVILMDETGEIPADVKIGKYIPLNGKANINIIVSEIQNAEYLGKDRKKLVVDQFTIPTIKISEYEQEQESILQDYRLVVRSKIKCLLTAGLSPKIEYDYQLHKFSPPPGLLLEWLVKFVEDERLDQVVNGIVGE